MTQKPQQKTDYFKVGDMVRVNEYHDLFRHTAREVEFHVIGRVVKLGSEGVCVDWGRAVRHPTWFPGYDATRSDFIYHHLPRYLDKVDAFESRVQDYVNKELTS